MASDEDAFVVGVVTTTGVVVVVVDDGAAHDATLVDAAHPPPPPLATPRPRPYLLAPAYPMPGSRCYNSFRS